MLVTVFSALVISVSCAFSLGRILPLHLPRLHPLLDRKPFNCRPCFSFHCTWLLMAAFAWLQGLWITLFTGFVAAFVVFVVVRYMDNKKIEQ